MVHSGHKFNPFLKLFSGREGISFFRQDFFSAPRVALTLESRIEYVLRITVAGKKSVHVKVPLEDTKDCGVSGLCKIGRFIYIKFSIESSPKLLTCDIQSNGVLLRKDIGLD